MKYWRCVLQMDNKSGEQYFNNLGEQFDAYMNLYDVEQRKWLVFESLLKGCPLNGKRVLEVGSGTGQFSKEIKKYDGDLTILDIGEDLVRSVYDDIVCSGIAGDACDLPFSDDSFDLVISSECIEHTNDPESAIQEMCRVCKVGGFVCITSPNRLWFPVLLLAQWSGLRKFSGIEHWVSPFKAIAIFKGMGMRDIKISGCHLLPFQLNIIQPILKKIDILGRWLFPVMINFGIVAVKGRHNSESRCYEICDLVSY